MPNWERFTLTGGRGVYEKRVSFSNRGVLTLNQPAFDELGKPEKVELFFDRNERLIGLIKSQPDVPHAVRVRQQGTNKSWLINARPFGYHYSILPARTIRFKSIVVGADGVMSLDLKSAKEVEVTRADSPQHLVEERREFSDEFDT